MHTTMDPLVRLRLECSVCFRIQRVLGPRALQIFIITFLNYIDSSYYTKIVLGPLIILGSRPGPTWPYGKIGPARMQCTFTKIERMIILFIMKRNMVTTTKKLFRVKRKS